VAAPNELTPVSLWINVDDNIEVAVGPVIAARNRTEDDGVTNAARVQSL
jgi:hypothetical protein